MERPERADDFELEPLNPPDLETGREERGEEEGLAGEEEERGEEEGLAGEEEERGEEEGLAGEEEERGEEEGRAVEEEERGAARSNPSPAVSDEGGGEAGDGVRSLIQSY